MKKRNYNVLVRNKEPVKLIKEGKNFKCTHLTDENEIAIETLSSLKKSISNIKLENPRLEVVEEIVDSIELLLHFAKSIGMTSSEMKCKREQLDKMYGTYDDDIVLKWVEEE